jgi:hypothetical protein
MPKSKRPSERFIQVPFSVLNSPAYRALGISAKVLFFDLRTRYNGSNNGNIEATLSTLVHRGWKSSATLSKALAELMAVGFIARTRKGGIGRGVGVCSLYRFTDLDSQPMPNLGISGHSATKDYAQYETFSEAKTALDLGVLRIRNEAKSSAYKKRNFNK